MNQRDLFPAYQMRAFQPPPWFISAGLRKHADMVQMLRMSWEHWAQAQEDRLFHLSPIIVMFNAPPKEIKAEVGGHVWHQFRTGNLKTNTDRMVLRLMGGWSVEEVLLWPTHERRRAKSFLQVYKSALLIACKHTKRGERLYDNLIVARDTVRLGGVIDQSWGKKRLKREHDALAMKKVLETSDPKPWDKPWFADIDGYTFTLLKSEAELAVEGASQKHCCRSYAPACRTGEETVFSVIGPERATASWNSRYKSLQVRGFANQTVKLQTQKAAMCAVSQYFTDKEDEQIARGGLE